jgi:hypothetical protein
MNERVLISGESGPSGKILVKALESDAKYAWHDLLSMLVRGKFSLSFLESVGCSVLSLLIFFIPTSSSGQKALLETFQMDMEQFIKGQAELAQGGKRKQAEEISRNRTQSKSATPRLETFWPAKPQPQRDASAFIPSRIMATRSGAKKTALQQKEPSPNLDEMFVYRFFNALYLLNLLQYSCLSS